MVCNMEKGIRILQLWTGFSLGSGGGKPSESLYNNSRDSAHEWADACRGSAKQAGMMPDAGCCPENQ
ncbi:hypothetical protein L1049_005539 [Liquidambar formosana]|uniref:Uncharacterized protein n=1 Tax=Liquidambar formosana TaxID=63359 RepID=A0AAP0WS81_LIQFO